MADPLPPYEMGDLGPEDRKQAPAAARNVTFIGDVLEQWLPDRGLVLETSSGSGEHALAFARRFPDLSWQPSDLDPAALRSIAAWREEGPDNLLAPLMIDTSSPDWPIDRADALLSINMVHISPWAATLGLLDGAARLLGEGAPLIFYGPWLAGDIETAASNLAFDESLKQRNPQWGLRTVEEVAALASECGFTLAERRLMPANNLMLKFVKQD